MLFNSATRCIKEVIKLDSRPGLSHSDLLLQIQEKTAFLVHDIHVFVDDSRLRTSVMDFSLLIKQSPKHFNAKHFFVIDFTLLSKMLSAMITYLVIFISFQPKRQE